MKEINKIVRVDEVQLNILSFVDYNHSFLKVFLCLRNLMRIETFSYKKSSINSEASVTIILYFVAVLYSHKKHP